MRRICLVLALFLALPASGADLVLRQGDLELLLVETGELGAVRSRDIRPQGDWSSQLRLIWLVPEGTTVAAGDTLARFDPSSVQQALVAARSELEREEAELTRLEAEQASRLAGLNNGLRSAEFAREQSSLRLSRMEFASETDRAAARLDSARAVIGIEEAAQKLSAQAVLDSLDRAKVLTRIGAARSKVQSAIEEVDAMVFVAPQPGLVVHGVGGEDDRKIRVGDDVHAGLAVVHLPDLTELEVLAKVHELDRAKVVVGQRVRIGFDAYDDLVLGGEVVAVAELAQAAQRNSPVREFEVKISVHGNDPRLRPGMTARAEIVVNLRESVLIAPRAALASEDGETVLLLQNGGSRHVRIGLVTETEVEIVEGAEPGLRLRAATPEETSFSLAQTEAR